MDEAGGLFARVREFQRICWDVEWQSEEYRKEPANWERIYFTRKLSIWITYALRNTRVTPNQITALWVFLGIAGAALLAIGDHRISILALFVLFLSWVLDNVDGELARFKKQFSIAGSLLDMVGHEIFFSSIFGALTLAVWWRGGDALLIAIGALATAFVTPLTKMQENVKLLLCLKALSQGERLSLTREQGAGAADESSAGTHARNVVRDVLGLLFTQTGMFYLLVLAVLFEGEALYLYFYGFGIPLALFPKYLVRARELERLAGDPRALTQLIRPEWLDEG